MCLNVNIVTLIRDLHTAVTCVVTQHLFLHNGYEVTRDLNYKTAIWKTKRIFGALASWQIVVKL